MLWRHHVKCGMYFMKSQSSKTLLGFTLQMRPITNYHKKGNTRGMLAQRMPGAPPLY